MEDLPNNQIADSQNEDVVEVCVTADVLTCEINKKVFKRLLDNGDNLDQEEWGYVLDEKHSMPELAESLLKSYNRALARDEFVRDKLVVQYFPIYVAKLQYHKAVDVVYSSLDTCRDIIYSCCLFNAKKILECAKQDLGMAISLLKADRLVYHPEDLEDMKELATFLENLPDKGRMEEVKGGIFSSGGLKYICEHGHVNGADVKYCNSCAKDIKGLMPKQREAIDYYLEKVQTLEEILSAE